MKVSGILPLRNGVLLGYPFDLAIASLERLCDEVVVLVDPTSEDDTLDRVGALDPTRLVQSVWDMTNHRGHDGRSDEIAKQTGIACAAASGDWIFSLQADEVIHEDDVDAIREAIERADRMRVTGLEMVRLYFYGGLDRYRTNWTVPLLRLFRRGCWSPDYDSGAMQFVPLGGQRKALIEPRIYHYSRVGDPHSVALRVRNLDTFYHQPEQVAAAADVPAYDFGTMRRLDTYVLGSTPEPDDAAQLVPFPLDGHPSGVREHFHA